MSNLTPNQRFAIELHKTIAGTLRYLIHHTTPMDARPNTYKHVLKHAEKHETVTLSQLAKSYLQRLLDNHYDLVPKGTQARGQTIYIPAEYGKEYRITLKRNSKQDSQGLTFHLATFPTEELAESRLSLLANASRYELNPDPHDWMRTLTAYERLILVRTERKQPPAFKPWNGSTYHVNDNLAHIGIDTTATPKSSQESIDKLRQEKEAYHTPPTDEARRKEQLAQQAHRAKLGRPTDRRSKRTR